MINALLFHKQTLKTNNITLKKLKINYLSNKNITRPNNCNAKSQKAIKGKYRSLKY